MPGATIGISLNLGFAGKVSRNPNNLITARFVKSILDVNGNETQPPIPFGAAVVLNTDNTYSLFGATGSGVASPTAANFAGIAVAEVKQVLTYGYGANTGVGAYAPSEPADVLERGSCTVFVKEGTPTSGGAVYIVTAVGSTPGVHEIGDFVATASPADGSTTVQLTNCKWTTGKVDSNGIAELTILTQLNP